MYCVVPAGRRRRHSNNRLILNSQHSNAMRVCVPRSLALLSVTNKQPAGHSPTRRLRVLTPYSIHPSIILPFLASSWPTAHCTCFGSVGFGRATTCGPRGTRKQGNVWRAGASCVAECLRKLVGGRGLRGAGGVFPFESWGLARGEWWLGSRGRALSVLSVCCRAWQSVGCAGQK